MLKQEIMGNRRERRIASGKNKRGLHKVKDGQTLLLVRGVDKFRNFAQTIINKDGSKKRIIHTQLINN